MIEKAKLKIINLFIKYFFAILSAHGIHSFRDLQNKNHVKKSFFDMVMLKTVKIFSSIR